MQLFETEKNQIPEGAHVGGVETSDGIHLRYAHWQAIKRPSKGTVLILSGRTEFIEKYFETVSDLRLRGFGVLVFDWRGQGGSSRLLNNRKKGYIEDFDQYVIDFNTILEEVALPDCVAPFYILGHSTGSLVALMSMPAEKNRIRRMVLTSPLLALNSLPFSQSTLKYLCGTATTLGMGEAYIDQGAKSMSTRMFKANMLTSDTARFLRNREFAIAYPDLVIGGATVRWIYAACKAMEQLADPEFRAQLSVPALLVGAGHDQVVSSKAAEELGDNVNTATCLIIDGARHEQLHERDLYREQLWAAFDAFIPGTE
jgi:lysophospholipase